MSVVIASVPAGHVHVRHLDATVGTHHAETECHHAQLSVLVAAADAVITLTSGAAAEIRKRWGGACMS